MRKALFYLVVAVVAGVLVTLVPLIALAEVRSVEGARGFLGPVWLGEGLRGLEGSGSLGVRSDVSDFTVITVSFVIAMVVYLFVRHRIPREDFVWVRIPPY